MQLFSTPFSLRAAALASMVVLGACSKKSEDTPTPTATYATTWTADGTNYTANNSTVMVNNNLLSIVAQQGTSASTTYSISMMVPAAAGTYSVNANSSSIAGYSKTVNNATTTYGAGSAYGGSGTIVVTTYSATEVIGTFSLNMLNASTGGTSSNGVTITNGKFSIKR